MLPEPPEPSKPPAVSPARRLSDAASDAASNGVAGAASAMQRSPAGSAAALARPAGQGDAPAATGTTAAAGGAGPLPLHWSGLVLGASTAAVAAGTALLFHNGLGWPATVSAVGAALVAVAAAAVPASAMARRTAPPANAALAPGQRPGVCTRALFLELAEREWARARRYGTGAALMLVDVDRHAQLTDTHGPGALDAVLAELARQTALTLRGADAIARFGPSQLAVFLAHADPTGALDVAERIRERAEFLQTDPQGEPTRLSVSLGVAQLRPAHLHLQALMHDAEDAVFAARQAGGNCVRAAPVDMSGRQPSSSWRNDHPTRPN